MAVEKKNDFRKDLLVYAGILFIIAGSLVARTDGLASLFVGLALLSSHTFDIKAADRKRIAIAETVLSFAVGVGASAQLALARSFGMVQFFIVLMLIGAILIVAESVRKLTK